MDYLSYGKDDRLSYVSSGLFVSNGTWIHPKRTIDSFEILVVLEGQFELYSNNTYYSLAPNDMLLIFPSTLHYGIRATSEKLSFYWLHFNFISDTAYKILHDDVETEEKNRIVVPEHFHFSEVSKISILFSQILHYSNEKSSLSIQATELLVNLLMIQVCLSRETVDVTTHTTNRRIHEVLAWTRANIYKGITIADVAKHYQYNVDYLSRIVKKEIGISLKEYFISVQLEKAKEMLLNSSYSIKEIAAAVGYKDENRFYKMFKKNESMTPSEYRNAFAKTHLNSR